MPTVTNRHRTNTQTRPRSKIWPARRALPGGWACGASAKSSSSSIHATSGGAHG